MKNCFIAFFSLVLFAVFCIIVVKHMSIDTLQNNNQTIKPMALPKTTFHQSAEDYNRFAVESYLKIVGDKNENNAVFSPYSLSMALEILYAGAENETAAAFEKILHIPPSDTGEPTNPMLFEYVPMEKEYTEVWSNPPIFLFGNALWYDNKLKPDTNFAKKMKEHYSLETFPVDFASDATDITQQMNKWCSETTQGLIPSLDPNISPDVAFYLLNTLYFKAHWDYKFQTINTKDTVFTLADGKTVKVATMCDEYTFPYYEDEELRALEVPYFSFLKDGDTKEEFGGDFSMVFILPKAIDGIYALEETLTAEKINSLIKEMNSVSLEVAIPKFRLEQENDLLAILAAEGQSPGNDFARMFPGADIPATISARQKITLGIDEHGTEAAVATEIGYLSLGSEPPKFIVDHPFLFLIQEQKTGTILFIGRVMNPTEK